MKKVKFRKSLAANITVIFLIFNILSIILFTYYVMAKEESKSIEYAKKSMQEIVDEKSELISIRFDRIQAHVQLLGTWFEKLLMKGSDEQTLSDEYYLKEKGTMIRKKDPEKDEKGQSNIILPVPSELTSNMIEEINLTEELDGPFEQILKSEAVTWAYVVTRDNLLRCSPYSGLTDAFKGNHNQIQDVFYTTADEKNNPKREPVWTKPYTDYLGTGWTMTCSQPIYDKDDDFYGVICLDIAINDIKEKYFEGFSLGSSGKVYWLDKEGNIFYHTDYDEIAESQGKVYEKNIFVEEEMAAEKEASIKTALKEDSGITVFSEKGDQKMMVYSQITGTDSVLMIEMDMKEFMAENQMDLKKAAVLIIIDLFLAICFAAILYNRFSRPMKELVHRANRISNGDYSWIQTEYDRGDETYYEVSQLNQAFKTMNSSIEAYTETLIDKNREISTILETIEGTLMIVDMNGNVRIQSKASAGSTERSIAKAIERIQQEKGSFTEQLVVDGEVYKNVYYPIMRENGEIDKIVISSECITKNILMEKEMQQLEKMAGVGQLSAAIVHELKNVLALIKGAAYILGLLDEEEKGKKEIDTIMKAVEEAENVITTLLDFSKRDESGSEMIHIGTLFNQILLLSKKEIIGKNIQVKLDVDEGCYVYSSGREAMKVILQNIILNAIQAVSVDGEIGISCYEEEGWARVTIRDNGGGIRIEPKERIFEPFVTTKDKGTGIGLWITKRLVDSLDGRITVAQTENRETEFVVSIPTNRSEGI